MLCRYVRFNPRRHFYCGHYALTFAFIIDRVCNMRTNKILFKVIPFVITVLLLKLAAHALGYEFYLIEHNILRNYWS